MLLSHNPLPSSQAVTRHVYLQPKYTLSESWFGSRTLRFPDESGLNPGFGGQWGVSFAQPLATLSGCEKMCTCILHQSVTDRCESKYTFSESWFWGRHPSFPPQRITWLQDLAVWCTLGMDESGLNRVFGDSCDASLAQPLDILAGCHQACVPPAQVHIV